MNNQRNFIRQIIDHHQHYYRLQNEQNKGIDLKKIGLILVIAIPLLAFWMTGFRIYYNTIISRSSLLAIASLLALIFFILGFFLFKNWKYHMSIITNLIIYYVHTVLFFSILVLSLNFLTISSHYETTKLEVIEWKLHKGRRTRTLAKVTYGKEVAELAFKGNIMKEVKNIDSLIVELNTGILGYAYVQSYQLDTKQ